MQICHRPQIHQGSNNRSRNRSKRSLGHFQFQFQFQLQILFFWLLFLGAIKWKRAAIMQQQQLSLNSTKRIVQKLIATFWWSTGSSSSSHNQFKWISVEAGTKRWRFTTMGGRQQQQAAAFLEQFIGFIVVAAVPKGHSDEGEGVCAASGPSLSTSSSIAAKVRDICKTSAVQRQQESRAGQGRAGQHIGRTGGSAE